MQYRQILLKDLPMTVNSS